jgi:hypothetical protein
MLGARKRPGQQGLSRQAAYRVRADAAKVDVRFGVDKMKFGAIGHTGAPIIAQDHDIFDVILRLTAV